MRHQLTASYITRSDGSIVIASSPPFALRNLTPSSLLFMRSLRDGLPDDVIETHANADRQIKNVLGLLRSRNVVRPVEEYPNLQAEDVKTFQYLSYVSDQPALCFSRIQNARVVILGCGGIGAICAESLLSMGFRHFVCIDSDVVEPSNLNRQSIFGTNDIGKPKALALQDRLKDKRPLVKVVSHQKLITCADDLQPLVPLDASLLVAGIDQPPILSRLHVLDFCLQRQLACTFSGVGLDSGSIGPTLTTSEQMQTYLGFLHKQCDAINTAQTTALSPSLGAANLTICALLCHDIFRFVSQCDAPMTSNKQILVRFNSLSHKTLYDGESHAR